MWEYTSFNKILFNDIFFIHLHYKITVSSIKGKSIGNISVIEEGKDDKNKLCEFRRFIYETFIFTQIFTQNV